MIKIHKRAMIMMIGKIFIIKKKKKKMEIIIFC